MGIKTHTNTTFYGTGMLGKLLLTGIQLSIVLVLLVQLSKILKGRLCE
nr:MAG TPA: hypothetical protein [Bacteriophage sp.]